MPAPQLIFWIVKTVALQFWPVWLLAWVIARLCRRLAAKGWRGLRLPARLGFGLVCLTTFAIAAGFCCDLHLALTSPGSALVVKGGEAEFGIICADAAGRLQFRTYQLSPETGIDLAGKARPYRERPLPIIRLSPEAPASPGPKRPVTDPGREAAG